MRRTSTVALSVTVTLASVTALAAPAAAASTWPGGSSVLAVDVTDSLGDNVSGLSYVASGSSTPGTMWAVRNDPSQLFTLALAGDTWSKTAEWTLRYPGGTGAPDAEGVTLTDAGPSGGVYVVAERNNSASGTSAPSVLRYAPGTPGTINATTQWNLSSDLTGLGANTGPEGIAWVPDSYLTSSGFLKSDGTAYNPASIANHGTGLFFVGVEQTGQVRAYALKTDGTFTKVATFASGLAKVTELSFDAQAKKLWALCDNDCSGQAATFAVSTGGATKGTFVATATYDRPEGMPNLNNEGFAIAPLAECSGGARPAYWADDDITSGHVLRAGTIACPTAPTITAKASAAKAPRSYWWIAPVTVTFTCTPGSAPITGGCPAPVTLSTSGVNQSVSRTVTNGDGLSATATVSDLDIDLDAPVVRIRGVKAGETYAAKKKPRCRASDALSGLATCVINQRKRGHTFKVTAIARDAAGNVTTARLTYKVKH